MKFRSRNRTLLGNNLVTSNQPCHRWAAKSCTRRLEIHIDGYAVSQELEQVRKLFTACGQSGFELTPVLDASVPMRVGINGGRPPLMLICEIAE